MNNYSEICKSFLDYIINERRLSKRTYDTYRKALKGFGFYLSKQNIITIEGIQTSTIQYYIMELKQAQKEVNSINVFISTIKSMFKFMLIKGIVVEDPSVSIQCLKRKKRLPSYFNEDEMEYLLNQKNFEKDTGYQSRVLFVSSRDKAMLELLYATGIRVSELVGIDLLSYDSIEGCVKVLGKGNKERIVPVGEAAIVAIAEYLEHRKKFASPQEVALFVNEKGFRTTSRNVAMRLKIYAQTHDFKQYIHPHKIRHTFATTMLKNSHDLRAVQELLGHAQLSSTQIYTHTDIVTLTKEYDKAHPRDLIEKEIRNKD